jgi:hypothetical protein
VQQDSSITLSGSDLTLVGVTLVSGDELEVQGIVNVGAMDNIPMDGSVTEGKIGGNAVTAAKIASGAVGTSALAVNSVTLTELQDGTQGDVLYYGASGAPTRLPKGTAGQVLKINSGATEPEWGADVGGKVLQMVYVFTGAYATGSTVIPFDDTIPQITEGNEVMTLEITPTSATSKLLVNVDVSGASNVQGNWTAALFRDSTANALATAQTKQSDVNPDHLDHLHLTWVADADSTSATTFKVRCGQTNAGDWYFNGQNASRWYGGSSNSGITITEISA